MLRWCNILCRARYPQYAYSTINQPAAVKVKDEKLVHDADTKNDEPEKKTASKSESKLVAAAFASLRDISNKSKQRIVNVVDAKISSATDIDSLLAVADQPVLGKYHALKVVSTLSEWSQQGKIKFNDFSTDPRFAKICRILGRSTEIDCHEDMNDLSVVLGVTADVQAAKLISSVELPQMVKVLTSLSTKKRRSAPLLRSLSYNISNSSQNMNIKEAADVFYACASLSYPDEVLLEKTVSDIILTLNDNKKPAVMKSIIKSIGMLRYRNTDLLNRICDWLIENESVCQMKEFSSMLFTLANINYAPTNFDKFMKILKSLLIQNEHTEWLDIVWSLIILDQSEDKYLKSVLNPKFVSGLKFKDNNDGVANKLKLININAYAKQQGSKYKGPLLDDNPSIFEVPLIRTRDKQVLVDSVLETLSVSANIIEHVRTDINIQMGFIIDVECFLDSKKKLVKLSKESGKNISKVAIMVSSYHDMCRGCSDQLTGITALSHRLLKNSGYKVLNIPFTEFDPKEKLMSRTEYISQKLKQLD